MDKERNSSVDILRFLGIYSVILIHTQIFKYSSENYGLFIFDVLFFIFHCIRLSVPIFFIASGYFFGKSLLKGKKPHKLLVRYLKRLGTLFILWSFLYLIFPRNWVQEIGEYGFLRSFYYRILTLNRPLSGILEDPFNFLLLGTEEHLWFFPSLMMAFVIIVGLLVLKKDNLVIPIAIVMYVFGQFGSMYSTSGFGYDIGFRTRFGPFLSTFFVSLGWLISQKEDDLKKHAPTLVLWGIIIGAFELYLLSHVYHVERIRDYLFAAALICPGVFLYAIKYPHIGRSTIFPALGKLTVGVYASHIIIQYGLLPLRGFFEPLLWDLIYSPTIYILALLLTLGMRRIPYLKILFT